MSTTPQQLLTNEDMGKLLDPASGHWIGVEPLIRTVTYLLEHNPDALSDSLVIEAPLGRIRAVMAEAEV